MADDSRQKFEKWATTERTIPEDIRGFYRGRYMNVSVTAMWEAWQAGAASACLAPPESAEGDRPWIDRFEQAATSADPRMDIFHALSDFRASEREAGRREGLEQAIQHLEDQITKWNNIKSSRYASEVTLLAGQVAAIRALLPKEGK
jgi:hypothetical protein